MAADAAAASCGLRAAGTRQRGFTLLEVVIATLIFALMGVMLLGGHAKATRSLDRAQVARDMAELLGLRLNLVALQPEEYEDGDRGGFPDTGKSTRIVDEEKIFGDRFTGYTWEVNLYETIGAGAGSSVRIEGGEARNLLFAEEGGGAPEGETAEGEEEPEVAADEVDRMLFIRVTIYPPGYEEGDEMEEEALLPRSAWTAIHLPESDSGAGSESPSGSGSGSGTTETPPK